MHCAEHETWVKLEVADWDAEYSEEPLGTKRKFWVADPDERAWLFKFARVNKQGVISGEDWAECVAHELALLLGIPTAHTNIASYDGRRGVLSLSVTSGGQRLEHGDELLAAWNADYDDGIVRRNPHNTVENVRDSLVSIEAPPGWNLPADMTAFDVWTGYLVLDAWVSGTDRHPQNWAAIRDGAHRWLAPSFDHGNALAFQERDDRRQRLVEDPVHLRRWAERGTNSYFADAPPLVELAHRALSLASVAAREHWLDRLENIRPVQVESVLAEVPKRLLSEVARSLCVKLLALNRERILHGGIGGP